MAPSLTALDALTVPHENTNTATAALVFGAAHVRLAQVVHTHPTASINTDTVLAAFGVAPVHMVQVVPIAHHAHTNTNMSNSDFDPKKFLEDLKHENAEELKARVLKRAEDVLSAAGASPERIREISILLPESQHKPTA